MSVFDAYSRYYDLLYRDKDYAGEADYIAAHIRNGDGSRHTVLELGCGTGKHAELLARRGFVVHGVDRSETMLAVAAARRGSLQTDIAERLQFAQGDVRTYRTSARFDAVISLFHVMSYQASNDGLDAMFATAASHLRNGGVFVFDFWYGPAVLTLRPIVNVKRLEDGAIRVTRVAEPGLRPNDNIVDVNYHVWVEDKASGAVQQIRETHTMRYLFLPEVDRLARSHNFTSWEAEEFMTARRPGIDTWGVCVTAHR
jgi:SAM-dependent methyltransferase